MIPVSGSYRPTIIVKIRAQQTGDVCKTFSLKVNKKGITFVAAKRIPFRDAKIEISEITLALLPVFGARPAPRKTFTNRLSLAAKCNHLRHKYLPSRRY